MFINISLYSYHYKTREFYSVSLYNCYCALNYYVQCTFYTLYMHIYNAEMHVLGFIGSTRLLSLQFILKHQDEPIRKVQLYNTSIKNCKQKITKIWYFYNCVKERKKGRMHQRKEERKDVSWKRRKYNALIKRRNVGCINERMKGSMHQKKEEKKEV